MKIIPLYPNERQLIRKARKGDRKAQKRIYELYAPKMLSVCRMYIRDLQFSEDVLLKGFFKVFDKLSLFREDGSFEGWIRRIMIREAIDFLRRKKQLDFSDKLENEIRLKADYNGFGETDYLQQLIDELPEGYRMVFVLAAIEGYKHREIAEMLNISEGTSKSQLSKARKMLQENLKAYSDGMDRSGK